MDSLAQKFVELRLRNPFIAYTKLLAKAQEEVFIPELRRHIITVNSLPYLKERILTLFRLSGTPETPPPHVIEIPVPAPVDFIDLANRLDLPSLMAILTKHAQDTLAGLRLASNGTEHPAATAKTAPVSLLTTNGPVKQRPARVAFCTGDSSLLTKLRTEIENNKIAVELRGVDIEHRPPQIPISADFVVFPKKALGGTAWDLARQGWGKSGRVFVVENHLEAAVQKMRDISSMKLNLPAALAQAPV